MNSATANTSAMDHLAITSTTCNVRARRVRSSCHTAHSTSVALVNGTMTLNSRISDAAIGLPTR
jgi:hypothetical protein